MIRLLLADDEDLIRGALASLLDLEDDLQVVAQAATTTKAVELAREHRPDIAVLDLEMPPADGLRAGELAGILRRVHDGHRHVDPEIAASALTEAACPLTDRELDVLRAARTGEPVHTIANQVHLAPGTVRNYLSSAMTKLDAPSRHAAAYRAWEEGWI